MLNNVSSLRYRYTQFFVLFLLCSLAYMTVQSAGAGTANFQDNLYKKDFLIEKVALLRIKLGDRVFNQALLGKDGWMEYTGGGNLDDFQNAKPLKNKKDIVKELESLNQYLKSQGITLLIVVAPNKASIYPDKLPEQIKPLAAQSKLDGLIPYLEKNNLPVMVDLRPALRAARQDQDVYYKTDTHWNGYGALVAYTTIINALGSSYPELKPYETTDLKLVTTRDAQLFGIARLMHANFITEQGFSFGPKRPFVQTLHPGDTYGYNQFSSISNGKLPTLLMFHDSFGSMYLNGYLSMNFEKSYFIHNQSISEYLTQKSIQQFEPDIIIIETVERNLDGLATLLSNFAPK
jgi:alginate O-acetyltransferase complex protein AlgJ